MIIGVDASKLVSSHKTGVELSTQELIKAVLRQDKVNTYWLYSPTPLPKKFLISDRVKNKVLPGKRLWTLYVLSQELKRTPPDIFWSPSNFFPRNLPKKAVITIHDLAFYLFPEDYSFKSRWLSTWALKKAIRQASNIIAVSKQTKKDLKNHFAVPGENIEVIYHSLRQDLFKNQNPDEFKKLYPKLGKYFLYVGRLELKKNLLNIIQAFYKFTKNSEEPVKLFLAGSPGFGYKKIVKLIKNLNLEDKVVMPGYIDDDHLDLLYKNSLGLIFASFYEGFGLNILEGFAAGIPVITSNLGAMREIAGNAAYLVDPFNIKDIAKSFSQVADDKNLRQQLINKGTNRLKDFSWEESADKLISLWSKI